MIQASPEYRMKPEDLYRLYAKNNDGNVVPYSNFMTMDRVYGPSQITITCGEKQLARFKRQRMAPGEMEHITLPRVLLAKADGPLTVAVEEVVAK